LEDTAVRPRKVNGLVSTTAAVFTANSLVFASCQAVSLAVSSACCACRFATGLLCTSIIFWMISSVWMPDTTPLMLARAELTALLDEVLLTAIF